jgi:hypothetical protein
MTHNGPAIKSVCVAEKMKAGAVCPNLGRVLVPARAERLKIALWAILAKEPVYRVERSMAHFLPSRYRVCGVLRVSRYRFYGEQVTSQGIHSFIGSIGAVAVTALQICLGCRSKLQKM